MTTDNLKYGYISAFRSLTSHWIWQKKPFSPGQAWIHLLFMANHKDKTFPFSEGLVTVKRGQLITSELKLMQIFGWSKSKVRLFLNMLSNDTMIVKKTDRRKTIITICNYEAYQNPETIKEPIKDQEQTDKRPIKDTNNKEIKKERNKDRSNIRFQKPTLEEISSYCTERKNTVNPSKFLDYYESNGWMVGKNHMKDWKATVRTWESNNFQNSGSVKPQSDPYEQLRVSVKYNDLP